jgi:hypothetical protein
MSQKGAILQLQAKGQQDTLLLEKQFNPNDNVFKSVFKKNTNFSKSRLDIAFNENVQYGKKMTAIIPKSGDLLSNLYFNFSLPPLNKTSGEFAGWTNSLGHAIIEYIELEIGGVIIDKIYGEFMEIWDELSRKTGSRQGDDLLIGKSDTSTVLKDNALNGTQYYVPLHFWFSKSLSQALPMIALQHHQVKVNIKLRNFSELLHYDGNTEPAHVDFNYANIVGEFIYLDDETRKYFAKQSYKYTISQLQLNPVLSVNSSNENFKTSLEFNHPVSELIWVAREIDSDDNNDWFNFSRRVPTGDLVTPLLKNCNLNIDGLERFNHSEFELRLVYPHSNITNKHIYVYSFAENPEDTQPSNSLNFSKLSDVNFYMTLQSGIPECRIFIYARNINWLIITKGMAGLAFNS